MIILFCAGAWESGSFAAAGFYGDRICSELLDLSMRSFIFQSIGRMIIINHLKRTDCRGVGTGKLSLIDHTDRVSADNTILRFQSGLRNIKRIRLRRTDQSEFISGETLNSSRQLIHIDACTVRMDILDFLIIRRHDPVEEILRAAA